MEFLTLKKNPYIIQKKGISTIDFIILFPFSHDKKHMYDIDLIKQIVSNTSKKYPTEQLFKKELLKNMIIGYAVRPRIFHNNVFLEFILIIPNPTIAKSFHLENALQFFIDMIYSPNIEEDAFNSSAFYREKEYIKMNIENNLKNIYIDSYQRFLNFFDTVGFLKNNPYSHLDLLEKSNPKDLFYYYKKIVLENTPLYFVYGDIDEKTKIIFQKYMKEPKEIIIKKDYDSFYQTNSKIKRKEEISSFNQSVLYMGYKIENMSIEDKKYLSLLSRILDGMENDLIFKALRIENNLIYSTYFTVYSNYGLFIIEAYLKESAKERAIQIIKDIFLKLQEETYLDGCLKKILKGMKYQLLEQQDLKYNQLNNTIDQYLELGDSLEEEYQFYKKIDRNKLIEFIKRVKLDTIYFLGGSQNE